MRPTHYLAIAVRVLGMFAFFYAIRQSIFLIQVVQNDLSGMNVPIPFAISTVILPFLASVILWYFPMMVAKKIIKPELDQEIQPLSAIEFLTVLILGIALYFLYYAFNDAVHWLTYAIVSRDQSFVETAAMKSEVTGNMVATAVEFVVSIALIMKARTVASAMVSFAQ